MCPVKVLRTTGPKGVGSPLQSDGEALILLEESESFRMVPALICGEKCRY